MSERSEETSSKNRPQSVAVNPMDPNVMVAGYCRYFDVMIGQLDRLLSEMLVCAEGHARLDAPDLQTLKHHADDLVGVGKKMQSLLEPAFKKQSKPALKDDICGWCAEPLIDGKCTTPVQCAEALSRL